MPADCATQQHAAPRPPEALDDARAFELSLDALAESHEGHEDALYVEIKQEAVSPEPPRPTVPQRSSSSGSNSSTRKSPRRSSKLPTAKKTTSTSGAKRTGATEHQQFSWNDILRVQSLIERCLQQHLSKNEIVATLKKQAKVEPSFTAVVWQKLEEQNPSFFCAYTLQLQLKEQIAAFNYLVSQQKEMMAKASSNTAFLSFLAASDARAQQRSAPNSTKPSSVACNDPSSETSGIQGEVPSTSSSSVPVQGLEAASTSLPMTSPIKTDLDTHAFFS